MSVAFLSCVLVGLLSLGARCFAILGEDASSVHADQSHCNAGLRVIPANGYVVHELQPASGGTVREFVAAGKVFAVTWHGPFQPDLRQLLGPYFKQYQQALQAQPGRHGPSVIRLPGLVVELGGHMRDFIGRAYLPDRVPGGVREEDLR